VQLNLYSPFMQVKTLRLAESLHKTQRFQFPFFSESGPRKAEKMIELTLGFRQEEYNLGNCGVFLYWHGRLIEVLSLYSWAQEDGFIYLIQCVGPYNRMKPS
jgi:hypothetical protein